MWYRANKMAGVIYAVPFEENDLEFQVEDIEVFIRQSEIIVLCNDLDGIAELFGVEVNDIEVVDD